MEYENDHRIGDAPEIDEFAIFRARAHGVESEYLEMTRMRGTRTGDLELKSGRGSDHSKSTRHKQPRNPGSDPEQSPGARRKRQQPNTHGSERRGNGPSYDEINSDEIQTSGRGRNPLTRTGSMKGMSPSSSRLLSGDSELSAPSGVHRTLSCRSRTGASQNADPAAEPLPTAFDRNGKVTSPKRRIQTRGSSTASATDDNEGMDTPSRHPGTPDTDKAVLRVRNFSTKTGNLINRGDSVKIRNRGGGGASGSGRGGMRRAQEDSVSIKSHQRVSGGYTQGNTTGHSPALSRNNSQGSCQRHDTGYEDRGREQLPLSEDDVEITDTFGQSGPKHLKTDEHTEGAATSTTPRRQAKVTICRNDPEDDQGVVYKVLVLGSQGVGKTTLAQQLLTSEYLPNSDNYADDESSDKIVSVQVDDEESLLQFIDVPAGDQASKNKDIVDANLVVYSVTERGSFVYAQSCLQELRPGKRHNVVILVANKQDIVRNRCISEEDGKNLATKRQCKFIEVSALLDHRIDELLVGITRQIRLRKRCNQPVLAADQTSSVGGPMGCVQRIALKAFRRLFQRRIVDSPCDDLYTA